MKLNEQATIELTASTWLVIAQKEVSKARALQLLGFESSITLNWPDDFIHDCPCCEYVTTQGKEPLGWATYGRTRDCAHICPLDDLWPIGCEYPTSPFKKWLRINNTNSERKKYAMKIAKFAGTLAGTWSPGMGGIKCN